MNVHTNPHTHALKLKRMQTYIAFQAWVNKAFEHIQAQNGSNISGCTIHTVLVSLFFATVITTSFNILCFHWFFVVILACKYNAFCMCVSPTPFAACGHVKCMLVIRESGIQIVHKVLVYHSFNLNSCTKM